MSGDPSKRQLELARWIALGLATKQAADEMRISVRTAETHRANLMAKTGCRCAADITRYAIKTGLISVTE